MRRKQPQPPEVPEQALTRPTTTLLTEPASLEVDDEPSTNRVQARIGRWRISFEWRPARRSRRSGEEPSPHPRHGWPWALGVVAVFGLGAAVALGAVWELVPYVETTRVVSELARLKVGGPACVGLGLILYLIRRLYHH